MLEIKNLSYQVPDESGKELGILSDVSLTVGDNKFVVITGPNGGGKTTLAKAIMGLVTPTSGQVLWNGTDMTDLSVTERARRGISYGFQQPPRFKGLRVRDLLEMASGREDLTHEEECQYLIRVGLCANDYIDREVDASLSGGEVKRIEIATILARQAGLMIFDEPEAGIDLWSFARLTETFQQLHEEKRATLLVISHQERIIDLADEIIMISGGSIVQHGPKEDVFPLILANTVSGCSYMNNGGGEQ
ncbi:MAG: ATP-binding cassette domain-containing protein [Intestinimonas sp.]|nr:ATP-binding cassette domain-containing protein [Intestinimonas sp.]